MNELDSLVASAQALFAQSNTPADLENAKAQFLGKSGRITELMKGLGALSVEEKKNRKAPSSMSPSKRSKPHCKRAAKHWQTLNWKCNSKQRP